MDEELEFVRECRDIENQMIARENAELRKYIGIAPDDFEPLPDMPKPPSGFHGWWR